MINDMFLALKNILKNRPKIVPKLNVDGYSKFILNDKNIKSKVALHIQNECRWAQMKYDKLHPDRPLPKIIPHVYRHTFCTNMVNMGMDAKVLQYIMGHSAEIDATMNIYTHMGYERASSQMLKLVDGAGKEDNRIISMAQTDATWSKTTGRFFYTPTTHLLHKNAGNL